MIKTEKIFVSDIHGDNDFVEAIKTEFPYSQIHSLGDELHLKVDISARSAVDNLLEQDFVVYQSNGTDTLASTLYAPTDVRLLSIRQLYLAMANGNLFRSYGLSEPDKSDTDKELLAKFDGFRDVLEDLGHDTVFNGRAFYEDHHNFAIHSGVPTTKEGWTGMHGLRSRLIEYSRTPVDQRDYTLNLEGMYDPSHGLSKTLVSPRYLGRNLITGHDDDCRDDLRQRFTGHDGRRRIRLAGFVGEQMVRVAYSLDTQRLHPVFVD